MANKKIGEFKDWKAMIEKLLRDANASREMYKNAGGEKKGLADAMYDVLVITFKPSEYDNDTRLSCLFKQLLKCTTDWERKEEVMNFTASVIAADYYLSVGKGIRAVFFLNKAL